MILFLSFSSWASEEVKTYCFNRNEPVSKIASEISFLQTGGDRIQLRRVDNCLDIYTSDLRISLYEKMLYRNYHPIENRSEEVGDLTGEHCRLEFKEIKKRNVTESKLSIGSNNVLSDTDKNKDEVTATELLMSPRKQSNITVGNNSLNLECIKQSNENYQIILSMTDKVKTVVSGKSGTVIDLASIVNELNEKKKTLGIPQSELIQTKGTEQVRYELKIL